MGTIDSPADTAFQILAYISLILNSSASTASIVLIDRIGELDFNSSTRPMESLPTAGWVNANAKSLLRLYGAGRSWMYVFYHCKYCPARRRHIADSGNLNHRVRFYAHRYSVFLGCISLDDLGPHKHCCQHHSCLCSGLRHPASPLLPAL